MGQLGLELIKARDHVKPFIMGSRGEDIVRLRT
jgi:hypothetical protein